MGASLLSEVSAPGPLTLPEAAGYKGRVKGSAAFLKMQVLVLCVLTKV